MKNELLINKRNLLEYSQQEIADLVGIDRSYYSKIENGFTPSVNVAKLLGQELGFDWTVFFTEKSAKNAQDKQVG